MHINRLGNNSIEFEHEVVEMQLSKNCEEVVEIVLLNYGSPSHIRIFVSNELKETVIIAENRLYVEYEEYFPIKIRTGLEKVPIIGNIYVVIENQTQNSSVGYVKDNGFVFKLNNDGKYNSSNIVPHDIQDDSSYKIQEKLHNSNSDLNSCNKTESVFYKLIDNIKNIKIPKIFSKSIANIQLTMSYTEIGMIGLLIILLYMVYILQDYYYYQFYMAIIFSAIWTTFLLHLSIKIMDM